MSMKDGLLRKRYIGVCRWVPPLIRKMRAKRNEIESFVEKWMDLETVIQSEVSQKEKNKYRMLMHVCGT